MAEGARLLSECSGDPATEGSNPSLSANIIITGGVDLIGKAAVLKTAARKRLWVRVPPPPQLFYKRLVFLPPLSANIHTIKISVNPT